MTSFRIKIVLFTFFFIVADILAVLYLVSEREEKKEQVLRKKISELQIAYSAITNCYQMISDNIFSEIINKPEILELLYKADTEDDEQQMNVRNNLYHKLLPASERLYNASLVNIHLQLPGGISFLRMYLPEKYGDTLINKRYSLKFVNENRLPVAGFEIGNVYNGFRFIYPILFNNNFIGTCEIGISYKAIIAEIEKLFKTKVNFIYKNETVPYNEIVGVQKSKPNIYNGYFSDYDQMDDDVLIIDSLAAIQMDQEFDYDKAFALYLDVDKDSGNYIVSYIPVTDFKGNKIAYLVSYVGDESVSQIYNDFAIKHVLVTFLLIALLVFIISGLYSIRSVKIHRDQLQSITDCINEGILVLDKELRVLSVNPAGEVMLGLYSHQIVGRELVNIISYKSTENEILKPEQWPDFDNINYGLPFKAEKGFFVVKDNTEIPLKLIATQRVHKSEHVGFLIVIRNY